MQAEQPGQLDQPQPLALMASGETAVAAAAAQATAMVQARYVMAQARPRDFDLVRARILKDCHRSGFAESALYHKPVGREGITGLSIRFAEAALRHMGNVAIDTTSIYEDEEKRIVRVTVTDLESNSTYGSDITIAKTVERRRLKAGQKSLGERLNSYGDTVYIVPATDDEIRNKEAALVSKVIRNQGLRLLPVDLKEEAEAAIRKTRNAGAKADPDAERKRLVDAFMSLHVEPDALAEYLGHSLATTSPAELVNLRALYMAIKDGEATWQAAIEAKRAEREDDEPTESKSSRTAEVLKDRKKGGK